MGELEIDLLQRRAFHRDGAAAADAREFELLHCLAPAAARC